MTNDEKLHSTARHLRQICSHKPEIKHKRRRFPDSPTLTYAEKPHGLTSRCQIAGYQIWFRVFTQAFWDDLQVWVKPFNVCGIKTFLTRIPCLRASAKFSSQGVVKPFIINAYNGSGPVFEPAGFNRLEWKVAWRKGMVFTSSSCNACLSALCGLWREAWKMPRLTLFSRPRSFWVWKTNETGIISCLKLHYEDIKYIQQCFCCGRRTRCIGASWKQGHHRNALRESLKFYLKETYYAPFYYM